MSKKKYVLAALALWAAYKLATSRKPVGQVVETKSGKVQGVLSVSRDGREFYEWLGIPYAAPPIGALRFEAPQSVSPWTGIRDASKFGSPCAQLDLYFEKGKYLGSEDCLYLNVFTPKEHFGKIKSKNAKPLPVFVYIHGGYFALGSSDVLPPDFLMDQDMVVVTINYRLNVFGFLSTGDEVIRGNMGLKDQNQALRWVQENIAAFGGDPNEVTIAGTSAGAVSVQFHLLSPLSKGLFKRGISFSGSALAPWALQPDASKQARNLAEAVNYPTGQSNQELLKFLKTLDTQTLLDTLAPTLDPRTRSSETLYLPAVETVEGAGAFLTETPRQLYAEGKVAPVPWISGITSDEGLGFVYDLLRDPSETSKILADPTLLTKLLHLDGVDESTRSKIREYYFGSADLTLDLEKDDDQRAALVSATSDRYFFVAHKDAVEAHARTGAPTYSYIYSKKDGPSFMFVMEMITGRRPFIVDALIYFAKEIWREYVLRAPKKKLGASHYDDLTMIFKTPVDGVPQSSPHYEFSKAFVKFIGDFVHGEELEFKALKFPEVRKNDEDFKSVLIADEAAIIEFPYLERYKFWKSLNLDS